MHLSRTSLTFSPATAEDLYRRSNFEADLRTMRVTYTLGIVLTSAYFVFDFVALGRLDPLLLWVRLGLVNAILAIALATTYVPAIKRLSAHVGAAIFLVHLVFFAWINAVYDTPYVYAANGVITLGFLYLVWPLPFRSTCAYGILGTIIYCGIVMAARSLSAELILFLLLLVSMNVICIFAMYQTEFYRRTTFMNVRALDAERLRYRELLTSVLPREVAERLQRGETVADLHEDVSVLFVDICDFTAISAAYQPAQVLSWLDSIFSAFDGAVERSGLEKIKTIGDSYMVAGGFRAPPADHLDAMVGLALDLLDIAERFPGHDGTVPRVRIGIHVGPVIAGVIGSRRFLYDLWGDTVNTASRMESHGVPGCIQVTDAVRTRLQGRYEFSRRDMIDVKGKGLMAAWLVAGRRAGVPARANMAEAIAAAPA